MSAAIVLRGDIAVAWVRKSLPNVPLGCTAQREQHSALTVRLVPTAQMRVLLKKRRKLRSVLQESTA
jgi:hypothetical protein